MTMYTLYQGGKYPISLYELHDAACSSRKEIAIVISSCTRSSKHVQQSPRLYAKRYKTAKLYAVHHALLLRI